MLTWTSNHSKGKLRKKKEKRLNSVLKKILIPIFKHHKFRPFQVKRDTNQILIIKALVWLPFMFLSMIRVDSFIERCL